MADTAQLSVILTALALLGQEPVDDLAEASRHRSGALVKLLRQVEEARDTVLRRHGWACALQYVTLQPALVEGGPSFRYPTTYLLPGDGLRVWEIAGCVDHDWGLRWQAGTVEIADGARQVIRSADSTATAAGLDVVYVRRAGWVALDAHVRDAVGHELAARACLSVTGDQGLADRLAKKAEEKALMAVSVDGTQEGGQPPLVTSVAAAIRNSSR